MSHQPRYPHTYNRQGYPTGSGLNPNAPQPKNPPANATVLRYYEVLNTSPRAVGKYMSGTSGPIDGRGVGVKTLVFLNGIQTFYDWQIRLCTWANPQETARPI